MEILNLHDKIEGPELDEAIVQRTLNRIQQFPTRHSVSAGGVEQIVNVS